MTASELHEIVKDWPREAWPVDTNGDPIEPSLGDWWVGADGYIHVTHAAALFRDSGLRWLSERRTIAVCGNRVSFGSYYSLLREWDDFDGPTLLHAISAAIKRERREHE